ncbi:MAG: SiaB family protein kinase [Magnetococcus sp. THC-1_WYH]
MLSQKQYYIRQVLHDEGVIFCYSGYMTEAILSGLGQAIKQKLAMEALDVKTIRGVFSVFVEQMQNVIRYSAEREPDDAPEESVLSYGLLTVGHDAENYFVTCGNKVQKKDVERLNSQLDMIKKLDHDGLKTLYKQILRGEVPEGSKGAGVGFVDIAKKASRPIEFDFLNLDGDYAYFSLKAYI